jgi:hypothetical protein
MPRLLPALAAALSLLAGACTKAEPPPPASDTPFWSQWGGGSGHGGMASVVAQSLSSLHLDLGLDPFVAAEQAETGGSLLVHYPAPLTDGPDVYVAFQAGTWTPCSPPGSGTPAPCGPAAWGRKTWGVARLRWESFGPVVYWVATSDWKPEPSGAALGGWEPVFQPALANGRIYLPGAGGSVWALDKTAGETVAHVDPFAGDPSTYVAGPLTADAQGNLLYNAIRLDPAAADPWQVDALGGWLVRVTPDGVASTADYAALVPTAPPAAALTCQFAFATADLPWPPSPSATAPTGPCGAQRPGVNVAPAVAPDGTIFTVSRAHLADRHSYLVAANPDLTPRWHRSLRGLVADGCGVAVPIGTSLAPPTPNACRLGTPPDGRDPATNDAPAARVLDRSSSSPVALPDGGVLYGAYTRYNGNRGHLLAFGSDGTFRAAYDFGWDVTPAVWVHGGTYSVVVKDNDYTSGAGLYCGGSDPVCAPSGAPPGPFYVAQLDSSLAVVEWKFQNVNDQRCQRSAGGAVVCQADPDHPAGFEWCINAPVVDAAGTVHAIAEDGFLYSIAQGGTGVLTAWKERIFLMQALGAAYTPLSMGPEGRVYAQNAGRLFVVGE